MEKFRNSKSLIIRQTSKLKLYQMLTQEDSTILLQVLSKIVLSPQVTMVQLDFGISLTKRNFITEPSLPKLLAQNGFLIPEKIAKLEQYLLDSATELFDGCCLIKKDSSYFELPKYITQLLNSLRHRLMVRLSQLSQQLGLFSFSNSIPQISRKSNHFACLKLNSKSILLSGTEWLRSSQQRVMMGSSMK